MSGSGSGGVSYAAYNPKSSKRLSTASIISLNSSPRPPSPSSSRTLGLIRPGTSPAADSALRAPQAAQPAVPSGWTTTSPPASSSSTARPSSPSSAFPFCSVPPGSSPFPPGTPRAGSPAVAGGTPVRAVRAPYLSSFQPQGVRRDRSDELMSKRRARGEGKKLDEGRLGRRLEKLVALHFPAEELEDKVQTKLSLGSIAELGESLRGKTAKELWRSAVGGKADAEKGAEQAIVKWQDDSEATRCPICMAAFGLKTRRHHCRLCGRVVCFLPPTPSYLLAAPTPTSPPPIPMPTRRERCSTFITYEYEGMVVGGEKKPVGVVVEIEQVEQDLSLGGVVQDVGVVREKDERKKVRVCRECLNVVLRQQEKDLPVRTPTWIKLYEVLVQLEKEIDESLPEFQELVLGIQKPALSSPSAHPSALHAQTLRKRLLTNLASYDTISKRIRDLPLSDGLPGGSQDRLQRAVAQRANWFLTEKLGLLRSLGNLDDGAKERKKKKGDKRDSVRTLGNLLGKEGEEGSGMDLELSSKLAVLLEQESLVKGYVEDANARRQFEDASSLKASLDELRDEIARVRASV